MALAGAMATGFLISPAYQISSGATQMLMGHNLYVQADLDLMVLSEKNEDVDLVPPPYSAVSKETREHPKFVKSNSYLQIILRVEDAVGQLLANNGILAKKILAEIMEDYKGHGEIVERLRLIHNSIPDKPEKDGVYEDKVNELYDVSVLLRESTTKERRGMLLDVHQKKLRHLSRIEAGGESIKSGLRNAVYPLTVVLVYGAYLLHGSIRRKQHEPKSL